MGHGSVDWLCCEHIRHPSSRCVSGKRAQNRLCVVVHTPCLLWQDRHIVSCFTDIQSVSSRPDSCLSTIVHDSAAWLTAAVMLCRMRFGSNFDWVRGGKLPGLCAGSCPTGCDKNISPSEGFSARIMWTECASSCATPPSAYSPTSSPPALSLCHFTQGQVTVPDVCRLYLYSVFVVLGMCFSLTR